ncbi:hypothetical protein KEM52_001583, partial [Ascosphaera acerosa]
MSAALVSKGDGHDNDNDNGSGSGSGTLIPNLIDAGLYKYARMVQGLWQPEQRGSGGGAVERSTSPIWCLGRAYLPDVAGSALPEATTEVNGA